MRASGTVQTLALVVMMQSSGCGSGSPGDGMEQTRSSASGLTTCAGADTSFDIQPSLTFETGFRKKAVLIQPDGKILAIGDCGYSACVSRYLANGTLDASFGVGGTARIDSPGATAGRSYLVSSAALQKTGKLVIAGVYTPDRTLGRIPKSQGLLLRLLPSGALDGSFGTGGRVYTDLGSGSAVDDGYWAVALDGNDKIVAAGSGGNDKGPQLLVARHQADGPLDPSFGVAGSGIVQIPDVGDTACSDRRLSSVAVDSASGAIFAAGVVCNAATYVDVAVVKLTGRGELDRSFGTHGGYAIHSPGVSDEAVSILVSGGRVVVASNSDSVFTAPDRTTERRGVYSLIGLTLAGRLDTSFGSGGTVSVDSGPFTDSNGIPLGIWMRGAVGGPDGKIVTAGHINGEYSRSRPLLMRFNANGVLDGSFGQSGRSVWDCVTGRFSAVAVQPDRRIVTGGLTVIDRAGEPYRSGEGVARFDP